MASAQVDAQLVCKKKCEPYGSKLPQNFDDELKEGEQFKEVIVRHGFIVDGIGYVIAKPCGGTETKYHGGQGGQEERIVLKCGELITGICGSYGPYQYANNLVVIATLKIHTNLRPQGYEPYGKGEGVHCPTSFSFATGPCNSVVGFFGRANCYLESLGVTVA